jgi:hypothetical protein
MPLLSRITHTTRCKRIALRVFGPPNFPKAVGTSRPQRAPARQLAFVIEGGEELIRHTQQEKNGAKFQRLSAGDTSDYSGDDSGADAALCSLLAYYTNEDQEGIDRLFRLSGLYRHKWDRPTGGLAYSSIRIQAALRMHSGPDRADWLYLSEELSIDSTRARQGPAHHLTFLLDLLLSERVTWN